MRPEPAGTVSITNRHREPDGDTPSSITGTSAHDHAHRQRRLRAHRECRATAGVDVRTVAGRLGHAHGGRSTLLYYAAWIQEADQRASRVLMDRLPFPAPPSVTPMPTRPARPLSPYRAIAAEWRTAILDGTLPAGATLPTVKELAARHQVAASTIHRATALLAAEHLIVVSRGRRAISTPPPPAPVNEADQRSGPDRRDNNRQPEPEPARVGGEWLRPVWLGSRVGELPVTANGWWDRVHLVGGWAAVRGMVRGMKPRQIRGLVSAS